jgi:hypothetical protein
MMSQANGVPERLLKLGRDAGELAVERAADRVDRRNDHHGDTGGDETILDRGSAGLVFEKRNNFGHVASKFASVRRR